MNTILKILKDRILILDGAMGTMIQKYNLEETDYRGKRFKSHTINVKGNNDLLTLTQPQIIKQIHKEYLLAGADIIETNTFNATSISMADYEMQNLVREINLKAAMIAKEIADEFTNANPDKPRFVAGSMGPTNKTASMSPDVDNPTFRAVSFDDLKQAYRDQAEALLDGGIDLFLVETIFDTLNAKAALFAISELKEERGLDTPIFISVTIADKGGRTLSGQTLKAFLASVDHIDYVAIGLNCSFGASEMKPYLKEMSQSASGYILAYPNAGLPNQLGEYDQTPEKMREQLRGLIDEKMVNILGGCCGTTPAHIAQYVSLIEGKTPKTPIKKTENLILSGLEALELTPEVKFINVGERCNVAGSLKFLRLIKEKKYEEALQIAINQVNDGAMIIDVNMDEALLDGMKEMTTFLNLLASDPDVSRVPIMIDSSRWDVIEAGLKCIQGKGIVNSISLKEGEQIFLERAKIINRYGAAMIIMAFDEKGQADTFDRKIEICKRAYELLTANGINPHNIIFDPNILTVATGIENHKKYAIDFLDTITCIRENLPYAHVSGGVSNLSFAFRGNNYLREAMHSVFLYHAINRGMDMGIVNPSQSVIYDEIPSNLRKLIEDVLFNRSHDATDKLVAFAENEKENRSIESSKKEENDWRNGTIDQKLEYALIRGINEYLEVDLAEALTVYNTALDIVDKPLMRGMNQVGELFGSGKMFLPQVVKSARTMKKAVAILAPILEKDKKQLKTQKGRVLIATVKGDVHDIGKNIVSIILACNNYEIIDLGVMVSPEVIIEKIKVEKPDIVCLSGLITPSLEEMSTVAKAMQSEEFSMPLLIGGATTSKLHTALKIAPHYTNGICIYVKDASQAPNVVFRLLNEESQSKYIQNIKNEYSDLIKDYNKKTIELLPFVDAKNLNYKINWENYTPHIPSCLGETVLTNIPIREIIPYIDWKLFFHAWKLSARFASIYSVDITNHDVLKKWKNHFENDDDKLKIHEAISLYKDAIDLLNELQIKGKNILSAIFTIVEAYSHNDSIFANGIQIPMLRQQEKNELNVYKSLSDFVAPKLHNEKINSDKIASQDYICAFAVNAGGGNALQLINEIKDNGDDYKSILFNTLLDRLAEATTEWLHHQIRTKYWGFASEENITIEQMFALKYIGIRPAVGYPSIPDQSVNFIVNKQLLDSSKIGIMLTENGVMKPSASVSGLIIAHPEAKYFSVGKIGEDQILEYLKKRRLTLNDGMKFLSANI